MHPSTRDTGTGALPPYCIRSARSMAGAQGCRVKGWMSRELICIAVGRGRTGTQLSDSRLSALSQLTSLPGKRAPAPPGQDLGASFILYLCAQRTRGKLDGQQRSETHAQRHGLWGLCPAFPGPLPPAGSHGPAPPLSCLFPSSPPLPSSLHRHRKQRRDSSPGKTHDFILQSGTSDHP